MSGRREWMYGIRRSPEDWARRIRLLDADVQAAVASVVWWDFADAWEKPRAFTAVFEPWLDMAVGANLEALLLERALRALGYPAAVASWRSADRKTAWVPGRGRGRPRGVGKRPWPNLKAAQQTT